MMGAHHAACGAAAWTAIASDYRVPVDAVTDPLREAYGWNWLPESIPIGAQLIDFGAHTDAAVLSGSIMLAGAALKPDADHHNATLAHSLPPVSKWYAGFIENISGGHRHGTHSIIGIVAFTIAAYFLGLMTSQNIASAINFVFGTDYSGEVGIGQMRVESMQVGAGLITVILSALAFKALKFMPDSARKAPWAAALPFGVFSMFAFPSEAHWLALVVGLGCLIHILGDWITTEGVNWFWPLTIKPPKPISKLPFSDALWRDNGYTSIPVLGTVSSIRAHLIGGAISAVAIAGLVLSMTGLAAGLWAGVQFW